MNPYQMSYGLSISYGPPSMQGQPQASRHNPYGQLFDLGTAGEVFYEPVRETLMMEPETLFDFYNGPQAQAYDQQQTHGMVAQVHGQGAWNFHHPPEAQAYSQSQVAGMAAQLSNRGFDPQDGGFNPPGLNGPCRDAQAFNERQIAAMRAQLEAAWTTTR